MLECLPAALGGWPDMGLQDTITEALATVQSALCLWPDIPSYICPNVMSLCESCVLVRRVLCHVQSICSSLQQRPWSDLSESSSVDAPADQPC